MSKLRVIPVVFVCHLDTSSTHWEEARVLLLQRKNTGKFPNQWCIPGGKMETGEFPLATALRELQEETGLIVMPSALERLKSVLGKERTDLEFILYRVALSGGPKPTVTLESDHFQGFGWFTRGDARSLCSVMSPECIEEGFRSL